MGTFLQKIPYLRVYTYIERIMGSIYILHTTGEPYLVLCTTVLSSVREYVLLQILSQDILSMCGLQKNTTIIRRSPVEVLEGEMVLSSLPPCIPA